MGVDRDCDLSLYFSLQNINVCSSFNGHYKYKIRLVGHDFWISRIRTLENPSPQNLLANIIKNNYFRTQKLTKCIQQIKKHLFKKKTTESR